MKFRRASIYFICAALFAVSVLAQDEEARRSAFRHLQNLREKKARRRNRERQQSSVRTKSEPSPSAKKARRQRSRGQRKTPSRSRASGGIPATGAKSVIMIDAHSGQTLYEKNPDEIRAAASTQKLLTALIVAEHGFLDRQVTVEAIDTMAEPVKLNIKPGDTYQRIDLLRALLVKSPNDVARCLARDNAGSIEAFAAVMNQRARELGATHSHFVNPNGLPVPDQYSTCARSFAHRHAPPTRIRRFARSFACRSSSFVLPTGAPASSRIQTKF